MRGGPLDRIMTGRGLFVTRTYTGITSAHMSRIDQLLLREDHVCVCVHVKNLTLGTPEICPSGLRPYYHTMPKYAREKH